ncbi:MAG: LptA/OstA family protein [Leptolyngbyaceae bacterium]|nr:LptA/OstA family protein [Leptolyngbyaceae bacterium]
MVRFFQLPRLLIARLGFALLVPVSLGLGTGILAIAANETKAQAINETRSLTLRADIQEANSKTGVVTARGNVQINYPARQIQATAAQAQYFSRERRIVLSGNVYVLQQGNSLRGETITYLIDEGRFVALPPSNRQVESTYIITEPSPSPSPTSTAEPSPSSPP